MQAHHVTNATRTKQENIRRPIASLISKSDKALQKLIPGTWQRTMLEQNLKALRIASALLEDEPTSDRFTADDLQQALHALSGMRRRTEDAMGKFSERTSHHTLLRNRLAALHVACALTKRTFLAIHADAAKRRKR